MNSVYTKDPKTKKRYLYLTDIYSRETLEKLAARPDAIKYKGGYLLPDIPSNHRLVGELSLKDGWQQMRDAHEKQEQDYKALLEKKAPDYAVVDEVLRKILLREPIQGFPDSSLRLMNHQKGGTVIAERFDKFAFFYDTGTGKTLMALDIIRRKAAKENAHFLILCPKTIINTAWMDDCNTFYPKLRILPMSTNTTAEQLRKLSWQWRDSDVGFRYDPCFFLKNKHERAQLSRSYMQAQADHLIVNFELFNRNPEKYLQIGEGEKVKLITGIVVDESSVLKSGHNQLYDNLCVVLRSNRVKYLYLFSGKPAPNKIQEYYSQIKLVAPYLRLPPVAKVEKGEKQSEEDLLKAIQKVSITVSKQDCFDLPETANIIRKVELDPQLRDQYSSLAHQFITELEDIEKESPHNKLVFTNHILSSISKLRQFTGGFVLSEGEVIHVHNKKLDELNQIVEELGGQQAIIWCQYQHEIRAIEQMLTGSGYRVATAYGGTKDKDASIRDFRNGNVTYLIAHPKTLQYGVTLTNCCYAIYYTTSYSFEEYYQSHDRIYRKGQSLPCTYIFIQADDTIDEEMYQVIMEKKNTTERNELFLKHMKEASLECPR